MKIAILTSDDRELYKDYSNPVPLFGTAPEALLQGFAAVPDTEVHVISCIRQPVKSPAKLERNIHFHSLHVAKIGWMSTLYQGCIRAIRERLRQINPDVVHGQGSERECAMSAIASGFPNVVTIHGNMAELARLFHAPFASYNWLAGKLETFALGRTAGVFCNSEYTQQLVRPRARRTWRVPNAIRAQFFAPASDSRAATECILLNVGLISPRKRQLELLDVAKQLHDQGLRFSFHFIGKASPADPYAQAFFEKIKPMESQGFAKYLGPKNTAELLDCFDSAAALVHFPSEEAFGLVVPEALARNLKLFGARLGGIKDIADGVPDADLVEINDWQGLTSAIAAWIKAGSPRSNSAPLMRSRYHPQVIAERHVEIYREVLARPPDFRL